MLSTRRLTSGFPPSGMSVSSSAVGREKARQSVRGLSLTFLSFLLESPLTFTLTPTSSPPQPPCPSSNSFTSSSSSLPSSLSCFLLSSPPAHLALPLVFPLPPSPPLSLTSISQLTGRDNLSLTLLKEVKHQELQPESPISR